MNPGAKANVDKAQKIGLRIAEMRSKGLTYYEIGKTLGISSAAAKQRFYRYNQHKEET